MKHLIEIIPFLLAIAVCGMSEHIACYIEHTVPEFAIVTFSAVAISSLAYYGLSMAFKK